MPMLCLALFMPQIKYAVSDAGVRDDMISKFRLTPWKQVDIFCNSGEIKDELGRKKTAASCVVFSVSVCAIKCLVVKAAA